MMFGFFPAASCPNAKTAGPKQTTTTAVTNGASSDAVTSATTTLGRRTAKNTVVTSARSAGDLHRDVTAAVGRRLAELGLVDKVRPRVTVKHKGRR